MSDIPPILEYRTEPPSDRIVFEQRDGVTRIAVPPQPFGVATYAGVLIFAPFIAFIGVVFLVSGLGVSGLSVLGIGAAWLLDMVLTKRRRTEFVMADGTLTITIRGVFATEDTAHALPRLAAIERVQLGTSIIGRRVFELSVRTTEQPAMSLLTGHDELEIQWVVDVLNAAHVSSAISPYRGVNNDGLQ
ncbi:MAG: hypothetical protein M3478_06970 [Planctomycetota bacterium]|nr:hypothetical protein [Planctomycetota bacterium]